MVSIRGVNRAGPNAGRADFLNCGPARPGPNLAGPNDFIIC